MLFSSPPSVAPPSRVVITGAGIITALGQGWKINAAGFCEGRSAIKPVSLFDVSRQRVKLAGEVTLPGDLPSTRLTKKQSSRLDRASRLLLWAAHEAWQEAGWQTGNGLPLVLGTTSGGMALGEAYYRQAIKTPDSQRGQATRVDQYQAPSQALALMRAFDFSGQLTIISNACASGANAIGHAWELVRRGSAQRVFAGGYDALCELVFSGFDSLQALSQTQCRPFDQHRDGLALGEGAGMLALESLASAQKRGATILGEIVGYGAALDVHHLTQPHPQGDAALLAMNEATARAGLRPEDIQYVNAHGTGTPMNDVAEGQAINRWAGEFAEKIPVSSTKPSIGHLLGAAGAVETIICLMALREQWLPPTTTINQVDSICRFPIVQKPTPARVDYALTNSFGFGGANASLILRRWHE